MKTVRIWRIDQEQIEELKAIEPGFEVGCIKATAAGYLVLGESDGHRVAIYDLSSMKLKELFSMKTARGVYSIALSKDERQLAVGCGDGTIAIWRVDKDGLFARSIPLEFKAHDQAVISLSFHPSATAIASGSKDQRVKVWNVADGTIKTDFGDQKTLVMTVAFSQDGGRLAAAMFSHEIKIWRWPSGVEEMTLYGHSLEPSELEFLRDGRTLVSCGTDRLVKIWDLESQQERFNLRGGSSIFSSLAISPDEKTFAAGARDGTVHFFRAANEEAGKKQNVKGKQ
jgi:WD40 repeat protein